MEFLTLPLTTVALLVLTFVVLYNQRTHGGGRSGARATDSRGQLCDYTRQLYQVPILDAPSRAGTATSVVLRAVRSFSSWSGPPRARAGAVSGMNIVLVPSHLTSYALRNLQVNMRLRIAKPRLSNSVMTHTHLRAAHGVRAWHHL